jgi:hypothetical protein
VAVAGLAVTAVSFEAKALQEPKIPADEGARLALIDYCVLQESSKHGQYANYVETCKCATSKLMSEMNQGEMEGAGKPPGLAAAIDFGRFRQSPIGGTANGLSPDVSSSRMTRSPATRALPEVTSDSAAG